MPIYRQIADRIIDCILRGHLMAGINLPGTRVLSKILGVNRNTIVAAYEELERQEWVKKKPNKGTVILHGTHPVASKTHRGENLQPASYPTFTGFSFTQTNILDDPFEFSDCEYVFNDGIPDIRLIQISDLSHRYSANLKRKSNRKKLTGYNQEGSEYFKANLCNYLNLSRGLHISGKNLLITRSTEMSVYITSRILLTEGDLVLVGELGYFSVNMILQKNGAHIKTVPIDQQGIDVDAIEIICKTQKVRMVYITPHHHYPTTVTLSPQRRIQLLELAVKYGFVILEDDYDYDFHYTKSPVLPLCSADSSGMVVYIGSFGKSLAPGFRTGFIVAPDNIMAEMRKYLGIIDRQGDILMEQVLGEMIEDGEIHRYMRKSLKVYQERRDYFAELLNEHLADEIEFDLPSGGLAFWLRWKQKVNLSQLAKRCHKNNLFIPKTLMYQNSKIAAMRVGFGNLTRAEMENAVAILKKSAG
ncbi:aminotransferase-like domain-containing protein [Pedobacter duraquae]|nr:PLP-dependent aminotransferase family protein [Pedobacter duraquae]